MDTYFRCLSLTLLFLAQLLSRGFRHSNQKHNFGPVKPNSHNKCKILHHSENRIAEELYYPKSIGLRDFIGSGDYRFYAGILFFIHPVVQSQTTKIHGRSTSAYGKLAEAEKKHPTVLQILHTYYKHINEILQRRHHYHNKCNIIIISIVIMV